MLYAVLTDIMLTRLRVSSERFLHDLTKAVTIIPIPKIANEKPNALKKRKKSFNRGYLILLMLQYRYKIRGSILKKRNKNILSIKRKSLGLGQIFLQKD